MIVNHFMVNYVIVLNYVILLDGKDTKTMQMWNGVSDLTRYYPIGERMM